MGRKSKKKKKRLGSKSTNPKVNPEVFEAPNAVAGTVAWLLAALTTALALVAAGGAWILASWNAAAELSSAARVLLFAAIVTGLVTLLLTPLVARVRRTPPPRNITRGAILLGILPIIVWIVAVLSELER